ncbi:PREDICTED: integrin alpha-9-like [Dinoponera quadriceps]|uniref:Integrin alpha-9-like n=1 Tax=Dinoponera quadriceps TaxID=609295 RepID=A0A6P3XNZ9_DINQU|nr:PREDICTED: integrin alpha-9-like [Dinoponera quadriceps]
MLGAYLVFALLIPRHDPSAYNIDPRNVRVFGDPVPASPQRRGSYFGFSVALYAGAGDPLLLVGAPRANSTALRGVNEPGTVFKCTMNGECKEWLVDRSVNGLRPADTRIRQVKDNAWIGANIAVESKTTTPRVVVCGPLWKLTGYFLSGICYGTLATGVEAFEKEAEKYWLPTFDGPKQRALRKAITIPNYAYAEVGFSLHMTSRNDSVDIVLGSPGVNIWKGDAILITDAFESSISNTIIPKVVEERQIDFNDYFGYAVTSGAYFKRGKILYASSVTRGANLRGKVLVFTFPPRSIQHMGIETRVEGEQIGEYFGTALTSCDMNNDGRDELIVGAPQWAKDVDEGRVYVFSAQHRAERNFKLLSKIEGEIAGGRFGSALMCLGDIDYDGYDDIAVGAPYEEESGGAVYIYNGHVDGVSRRYSQRLVGSRYSPLMRGFGISISEPRDVDGDRYPDVAVGAYLSEKAVLLRAVPVVTLNVTLARLQKIRLLRNTTSFVIDMHVYYEGAYVPESLRIVKVLKIDQTHGRAAYREQRSNDGTYRIPDTLYKNNSSRSQLEINFMEEIRNLLDPLEIFVSVELEDDLSNESKKRDALSTSHVAINKLRSRTEDLVKLPFAVDCGEDEICVSDLNVTLTFTDLKSNNRHVIGSSSTISLRVDIYNRGEPAYQSKVHISIETLSLASIPPECTEDSHTSNFLDVVCEIGNPLRTNRTLSLQLDTSMVTYDVKKAVIRANVSTHSNESTLSDNHHVTTVYFDVDMDVAIVGKALVSSYSYTNEKTPLENVRFQHFYEIQRFGISPIEKVGLTVRIPTHWRHGSGDIAVAAINNTVGVIDGSPFQCGDTIEGLPFAALDSTRVNTDNAGKNASMNVPSANRTLYINCTNDAVRCEQITCYVGPFPSTLSVAKLLVTLDLQIADFHATLMKDKDIVFLVTEGEVTITQPCNISQRNGHKPDVAFVATTFLGSPVAERIAAWILALSIALGIILLILLILGLIKIGFFNRKQKMELEALKAATDVCSAFSQCSVNESFDH